MITLFESTGDVFGTNKDIGMVLPVKYLPRELRNATTNEVPPMINNLFMLYLPDRKLGTFYYSPSKEMALISAGQSHVDYNGNLDNWKIYIFFCDFALMEKGIRPSKYLFYELKAEDMQKMKDKGEAEIKQASNYVRNCIKQLSLVPLDKVVNKLVKLMKHTVQWTHR